MAEDQNKIGLHVDTDWKKQAQEEKRRLAEEAEKRKAAAAQAPAGPAGVVGGAASASAGASAGGGAGAGQGRQAGVRGGMGAGQQRELPQASFGTLVQSILTQVLFYLGELQTRGGEPMINLDMAKHNID